MRSHILFTTAILSLPPLVYSIYLIASDKHQPFELESPLPTWGHEDFFSRGYTIPLACATAPILERIPTISSKKAERILQEQDALLQRLLKGETPSFASVHGIGEKGARFLERYISYNTTTPELFRSCER
jgi:hypothetical protein